MSQLIDIIEKLSKSSPQAVFTPKIDSSTDSNSIFQYLHVVTDVEQAYIDKLEEIKNTKSIVFLCGSSGDGKSAIIGQNQDRFLENYTIHIDATHSFKPDQSAIEALDIVFDDYKKNTKSLVVGINIGILVNFSRDGSDRHKEIKEAINNYINLRESSDGCYFINFENYPKFEIDEGRINSPFIAELFSKVAIHSNDNPFYQAYLNDIENSIHTVEHKNLKLLSLPAIQKSIIELLVTVHLKYDQFLTTRSIIDFIYILLRGPKHLLIDQLFEDDTNPIIVNTRKEDPILYRTKQLDTFVLNQAQGKENEELDKFINQFNEICKKPILSRDNPHTLIRAFFLFKDSKCSTNFHHQYSNDFDDSSTLEFIKIISAHKSYSQDSRPIIQHFYEQINKAIFAYANKHMPTLTKKEYFSFDTINGYSICSPLEIETNYTAIKDEKVHAINNFKCYLNVNSQQIEPIVITLSMYKMILAINQGYRPNKHDRNSIVIFEELLIKIADKAKASKKLIFVKQGTTYTFKNNLDEIRVTEDVN